MSKRSLSVAVLTERKSLENKISRSLPSKSNCRKFTNSEQLVEFLCKSKEDTIAIIEYNGGVSLKRISEALSRNKNGRALFIIAEHSLQKIASIIKYPEFDFIIDTASLGAQLKKKIESGIRPQKQKKAGTNDADFRSEYFNLLENMIIGIYRTTPDGKILLLNKAALQLVGLKSMKEAQKVNLEDEYFDPYHLRKIFKKLLKEKGEVVDFENHWRRPDGKMMIVRENARAIKNRNGSILYYEGTFEDITTRVEIEKALIESEKKLHLTLEAANIGIWNWSIKTNEIYFSREFSKMLGYTSDELKGSIDTFVDLFYAEDQHLILTNLLSNVNESEPDFETEVRMVKKSGELRWMLTKGKVIEWSGNIPLNIIAIQIDITDRKISESKIIESESRFRELAENIEEIFWLMSDNEIIYISPGLEKIWGVPAEENNRHFIKLYKSIHADDRIRIRRAMQIEVIDGPGIFNEEFRIVRPDGVEKWLWARTFPVKKGNETHRSVGIAEDITARKRLQIELEKLKNDLQKTVEIRTSELVQLNNRLINEINKQKKSEEEIENQLKFFRTLIETAASPMFIKDADKKYIDCNKAFEEYFDESRERIIGKSDSELLPAEAAMKFEAVDDALLKNPGELTYEDVTKHSPPNRKEYMITKSTFLKSDGKPGGLIAFVTDITQKKRLELSIQKAFNKEKELLDLKSKLISTASHEFRTPLTTILSSIDLIDIYREKENLAKYYNHIDKIKSSVKYMIELLNDVMIINKTESGKLEYSPGETDVVELCREIISEVKQTNSNGVKILFKHSSSSPSVLADKKLLKLIISNLLSNAVKYSNDEGTVTLSLSMNGIIELRIEDSGIGIPSDELPMIYEPFHRGKNVSEKPGTGLGLSIVKRCVDLHKGKISFTSRLNEGTVFNVQIPIIKIEI